MNQPKSTREDGKQREWKTNKTEKKDWESLTLSNQPGSEAFLLVAEWPAMCFKSFFRVWDKACHQQHYLPILVWPNSHTFHPSHVNGPIHDPNWPLLQRGCLELSGRSCLNCACETGARPQGHFSLGGESKPDKHKQEFQLWPRPSGVMPLWRTHQTGSFSPCGPDPIPDRSQRSLLHFIKHTPVPACQQIERTGTVLCSHINTHTNRTIC